MDEIKSRKIHTLTRLPGITDEIAQALYEAGYHTKADVWAATDADLKKVKGVTTAKLNALKAHKDSLKEKPWEK